MQSTSSTDQRAAASLLRRALRIATSSLAVLSLLLSLAAVALCVRSYRALDRVYFGRVGGNAHVAQSIFGRLHLLSDLDGGYRGSGLYKTYELSPRSRWDANVNGYPDLVEWHAGLVWQTYRSYHMGLGQTWSTPQRLIVVPYWFLAAIFALAPVVWITGRKRRIGIRGVMILVAAIAVVLACMRPPAVS